MRRLDGRYETITTCLRGFFAVACILALALPVREFVQPIAGKTTTFTANVVLSVTLCLSIALHGLREAKGYSRRQELKRMRERTEILERRLGINDERA
jgi:hypothetical protein